MNRQRGFSMIEVLVTIIIIAFGLLGLAGLQARTMNLEMESYQRSQALVLIGDMVSRLESAVATAGAAYVTGTTPLGTGNTSACATLDTVAKRDLCAWSTMLKGAAETSAAGSIGAMAGARGCITEIQAPDPTNGVCTPGIYEVAVAWQGMVATVTPANDCGAGLYGADDAMRRVITLRIAAATTKCVP